MEIRFFFLRASSFPITPPAFKMRGDKRNFFLSWFILGFLTRKDCVFFREVPAVPSRGGRAGGPATVLMIYGRQVTVVVDDRGGGQSIGHVH